VADAIFERFADDCDETSSATGRKRSRANVSRRSEQKWNTDVLNDRTRRSRTARKRPPEIRPFLPFLHRVIVAAFRRPVYIPASGPHASDWFAESVSVIVFAGVSPGDVSDFRFRAVAPRVPERRVRVINTFVEQRFTRDVNDRRRIYVCVHPYVVRFPSCTRPQCRRRVYFQS